MITKPQKKRLYKLLKGPWIDDVLLDLHQRNITNRNGDPYSVAMIRHVMSGRNANEEIEKSILNVYDRYRQDRNALENRKRKLLSA